MFGRREFWIYLKSFQVCYINFGLNIAKEILFNTLLLIFFYFLILNKFEMKEEITHRLISIENKSEMALLMKYL